MTFKFKKLTGFKSTKLFVLKTVQLSGHIQLQKNPQFLFLSKHSC